VSGVVVVGSVNLDLVVGVDRLPRPGETLLGGELSFRAGGKGANQAVAANRLGVETLLFAATGADRFGDDLRTALSTEELSLEHVSVLTPPATGVALIVVDRDGENSIVVAAGANGFLTPSSLVRLADVLDPDTVLLLQLEVPVDTVLAAARMAAEAGATVVLNAAPLPAAPGGLPPELLQAVDVLVVNEGEAQQLAGEAATPDSWPVLADRLRALGPRAAVVTLGARGAVASSAGTLHVQPPFPVDTVDATGAGDSFCGALAVALHRGLDLAEATRWGCAAGALATTRLGAQDALPTPEDLRKLLEQNEGDADAS
jgi:ribokinase